VTGFVDGDLVRLDDDSYRQVFIVLRWWAGIYTVGRLLRVDDEGVEHYITRRTNIFRMQGVVEGPQLP
jgi:hypothetical protein